ncbi:MAG: metal ABC transporter permease [Clostridia bacterium]|nr:metal ABC transporter permease [Clostridia bacterium]
MNNIFETLEFYLSFPFVRYALIVGILISLCAALLGVILVLKRFSYIGEGLSHTAFGTMAIAAILNLTNDSLLVIPVTIICAILLLKTSQNKKINGDALVAIISVSALAIGYLLLNIFDASSNISADVCTTLFGSTSILTLSSNDVLTTIILTLVVIVFFILFYNKIFAVTFDENFAKASGTKIELFNIFLATIIAIVIVVAMNLVGSLLVSALIIFPALSSMRIFKSFKGVTISSAVISIVCAFLGLILSILFGTPVGSTIIAVNITNFAIFYILGLTLRRSK